MAPLNRSCSSCRSVLQCMQSRQPLITARRENYRAHSTQSTRPIKSPALHSYWFSTKNKITYIARQTTLQGASSSSDELLQRYITTYTLNCDLQFSSACSCGTHLAAKLGTNVETLRHWWENRGLIDASSCISNLIRNVYYNSCSRNYTHKRPSHLIQISSEWMWYRN
jgi:hypothetical protein